MTPAQDDFFEDEQHEASRLKVEAYGKYLKPLSYKLLSWNRRLYVVDGFAGAGLHSPDEFGQEAPGSPLVAAQFAHQYNVDHHRLGREVRLINVEKRPAFYEQLCRNLAGFGELCLNLPGSFEDQLPRVLQTVGRRPALFFLDSFGMQAADIRVLDAILAAREGFITEFLIHFSDRALNRIAGNLHAQTTRSVDRRAAESKLQNIDGIIGSPWWRGCFTSPELHTAPERCDAAAMIYMGQLEQRGIQYVNELRMRDAYDDPARYRLIFATRNPHGTYLMNDIAAKHESDLFESRFEGTFELSWKREERAAQRAALRTEIHQWGIERGHATKLDVLLQFTPKHFGRWRTHDYDECLRELVDMRGIDRPRRHGIGDRESLTFIPIAQASLFDEQALATVERRPAG